MARSHIRSLILSVLTGYCHVLCSAHLCPLCLLLLCCQVAGTSGKVKLDGGSDDEGAACETYGTAIKEALGRERNAEVLSKLYVARSDVQYVVRNTALHIWKTIVVNTPRTLQEILPALMAEVISALADPGESRGAVIVTWWAAVLVCDKVTSVPIYMVLQWPLYAFCLGICLTCEVCPGLWLSEPCGGIAVAAR